MDGFEYQLWRIKSAADKLAAAHTRTPLFIDLSGEQTLRLVYLVADADINREQISRLIQRMNAGESLFTLSRR